MCIMMHVAVYFGVELDLRCVGSSRWLILLRHGPDACFLIDEWQLALCIIDRVDSSVFG